MASSCPVCATPGAYIGLTVVECSSSTCRCYHPSVKAPTVDKRHGWVAMSVGRADLGYTPITICHDGEWADFADGCYGLWEHVENTLIDVDEDTIAVEVLSVERAIYDALLNWETSGEVGTISWQLLKDCQDCGNGPAVEDGLCDSCIGR